MAGADSGGAGDAAKPDMTHDVPGCGRSPGPHKIRRRSSSTLPTGTEAQTQVARARCVGRGAARWTRDADWRACPRRLPVAPGRTGDRRSEASRVNPFADCDAAGFALVLFFLDGKVPKNSESADHDVSQRMDRCACGGCATVRRGSLPSWLARRPAPNSSCEPAGFARTALGQLSVAAGRAARPRNGRPRGAGARRSRCCGASGRFAPSVC